MEQDLMLTSGFRIIRVCATGEAWAKTSANAKPLVFSFIDYYWIANLGHRIANFKIFIKNSPHLAHLANIHDFYSK